MFGFEVIDVLAECFEAGTFIGGQMRPVGVGNSKDLTVIGQNHGEHFTPPHVRMFALGIVSIVVVGTKLFENASILL